MLELDHLTVGGHPAQLIPGPLGTFAMRFGTDVHPAPNPRGGFGASWPGGEIRPAVIAYRLVREVYRWFGLDDDDIPYTAVSEDGENVIDPEAIRRGGRP